MPFDSGDEPLPFVCGEGGGRGLGTGPNEVALVESSLA